MNEHQEHGATSGGPGFAVGIDLGTTHCALAVGAVGSDERPETIGIPQVVEAGQTDTRDLLPSFLYLPNEHEFGPGSLGVPWNREQRFAVGQFARKHGAKVPDRLVASAKSWLCHDGVDRQSALLPWGAGEGIQRISPLEASTRYLQHLAATWAHARPEA